MELPKHIRDKVCRLEQARDALEAAIMSAIDIEAANLNLDEVVFTGFSNGAYQDGKELETFPPTLEALDDCYLEYINSGGFQALWNPKDGWC